jgi:hypothetical protein
VFGTSALRSSFERPAVASTGGRAELVNGLEST